MMEQTFIQTSRIEILTEIIRSLQEVKDFISEAIEIKKENDHDPITKSFQVSSGLKTYNISVTVFPNTKDVTFQLSTTPITVDVKIRCKPRRVFFVTLMPYLDRSDLVQWLDDIWTAVRLPLTHPRSRLCKTWYFSKMVVGLESLDDCNNTLLMLAVDIKPRVVLSSKLVANQAVSEK